MARRPLDFMAMRSLIRPEQVLRLYGWSPVSWTRTGARGPCPVHRSTYPRSRCLVVSHQVVYCHKCRWKGDALALHARLGGRPLLDAAYDLCERFGIAFPFV